MKCLLVFGLLSTLPAFAGAAAGRAHLPTSLMSPYQPAALRRHYEQAAGDKQAGEKFYQLLHSYAGPDALVLGYKAASEAIKARDASLFDKLTYVQQAARTFEQAVALAGDNAEIRFLRFSVESNLPAFLGLSKHVDEDRAFLLGAALQHPRLGPGCRGVSGGARLSGGWQARERRRSAAPGPREDLSNDCRKQEVAGQKLGWPGNLVGPLAVSFQLCHPVYTSVSASTPTPAFALA